MVPPFYYLILSFALFLIGTTGVLLRRNALIVLMGIELQLNAGNLAMLTLIIALAAAEAAVGLAILVGLFRSRQTINLDEATLMKR